MQKDILLEMKGIKKSFPGVKVFDGFDFDIRKGEVHCICGENGAGKSTLIKMLSGAYTPDEGQRIVEGQIIEHMTPRSAMKLGIQTIYQEHALYPLLTVTENLFAGNEISKGVLLNHAKMTEKAKEVLERLHSDISPFDIVGQLGSGEQKTVEIARALIVESKIMILDEPTASFSKSETQHLLKIIKKLASEGISIIYISHHLEEVFEIADRVTVIRDGQKINTYEICDLTVERLIKDMVGRDVSAFYKRDNANVGDILFEAENVSGNGVVNASVMARSGELVGIAGMVGSGRTEFAELLFGVKPKNTGTMRIRGKEVKIKSPLDAIANKMCYITEDRQHTGLFLIHSIIRNSVIASYAKSKKEFVTPAQDIHVAEKYSKAMNVVTPNLDQKVMFLSGGNQQKVVLTKWFATDGDIYIFDEPTRGIDIGAKEEIYKIMTGLLQQGKCIIMISSDMPELIAMSDRIMVMRDGSIVAEIDNKELITEENILNYSIGGALDEHKKC